jgi:hypothetical protein
MEKTPVEARTKICIYINQHRHEVGSGQVTGTQLKALAAIPENNLLFREAHGPGDDEQIQDQTLVHVHDGDHLYDMPPGNFGC